MEDSSGNSERRRRLLDALQKSLDEAVLELHTYEKALALFEDDPSTSEVLQQHLLNTVAAPVADKFLHILDMDNKLKKGVEISGNLHSAADRASLAKALPQPLSTKAQSLVGALEGKRVDAFMDALRDLAEESGLLVKNPNESLELSKFHAFHKDLTEQVSSETDKIALLPKVVALLFLKVYKKAILVPGSAIPAIISRLKGKLPEQAFKLLTDYHKATVTLSALRAAATGADDEGCLVDRIQTKEEILEEMMPKLKAMALGNLESGSNAQNVRGSHALQYDFISAALRHFAMGHVDRWITLRFESARILRSLHESRGDPTDHVLMAKCLKAADKHAFGMGISEIKLHA